MVNSVNISGESVINHIKQIAQKLGATVIRKNRESLLQIPGSLGSGFFRATEFSYGLSIIEFNALFKYPFALHTTNDNATLKLIFNLQNNFEYSPKPKLEYTIEKYDSVFHSLNSSKNCYFKLPANASLSIFVILIDKNIFESKIKEVDIALDPFLIKLFKELKEKKFVYNQSKFSLSTSKLIEDYKNNTFTGFMKHVYQEAKINEIIVNFFKQYVDDQQPDKQILRKYTLNQIHDAATIINAELDNLPNIKVIANRVGLSQNLLQSGFRYQFDCSVHEYILTLKLKRATYLLENSELTIAEITFEVGINSKSYFSKIFKEKYGLSPRAYKKQYKLSRSSLD